MAAAAGAGAGAKAEIHPFPVGRHLGSWDTQYRVVRVNLEVPFDHKTLLPPSDRDQFLPFACGSDDAKCDFRVVVRKAGQDNVNKTVDVHIELLMKSEYCQKVKGVLLSLEEDAEKDDELGYNVFAFCKTTMRGMESWLGWENQFTVQTNNDVLTIRVTLFLENDRATYAERLVEQLYGTARWQTANAMVVSTTGETVPIDKNVVLATACSELSKPFCDTTFHTARMKVPEVAWDLEPRAVRSVIHALYTGPENAWRNVTPTAGNIQHATEWLSIARFFHMHPVGGALERSLQLVKLCIAPSTYSMIMRDALIYAWEDVIRTLEECVAANAASVVRGMLEPATGATACHDDGVTAAADHVAARVSESLVLRSRIPCARDTLVDASVFGLNIPLKDLTASLISTPKQQCFPSMYWGDSKWCLLLSRFLTDPGTLKVQLAVDKQLPCIPITLVVHFPDLIEANVFVFRVDTAVACRQQVDGVSTSHWVSQPSTSHRAKIIDTDVIRSMRVSICYDHAVTVSRTAPLQGYSTLFASADNITERMLLSAKRGEGVDVQFVSRDKKDGNETVIAPFAHLSVVREHTLVLKRLCDAALVSPSPRDTTAVGASTGSGSPCRVIPLDAVGPALFIFRDALYCNAKLWPELLDYMVRQPNAVLFDVVVLCAALDDESGASPALETLSSCAREIITSRVTSDTLREMMRLVKQPKYAALFALIESCVLDNPACLTQMAKGDWRATAAGYKRPAADDGKGDTNAAPASAAASGSNPPPSKKLCVSAPTVSAAAAATVVPSARSLE